MGHRAAAPIGINDIGDVQARLSTALKQGSEFIATQAIAIGQGTAHIVVSFFLLLYLLFFFLRDGRELSQRLKEAIPLGAEQKRALFSKFATVSMTASNGCSRLGFCEEAFRNLARAPTRPRQID